ncbi:uncharacterized protein LOC115216467 [Argonauta hians]
MKRNQVKKERQPSFSQSGPKAATGEGCSGIRRKLTYKNKLPLEGKKIYLDLRGVKLRNVEDSLTTFGAIIEKFLSKEIHYFVTDNPKAKEKNDDTSVSGSTSLCISSPFNSGQTPSPSTFDKKAVSVTRGRAMLQCVKLDSSHENIVDKARKLGVKVVSYTNLIKWLNKEKPLLESTKAAAAATSRPKTEDNQKKKKIKLKHLRRPFIKFEALNKHYRPVVMEFISWPHINLAPSSSACPFDEWLGCVSPTKLKPVNKEPQLPSVWSAESANPQNASNVIENKDPQQEDDDDASKKCDEPQRSVSEKLLKRRLSNWERRRLAEKKQKQGFCECCDVRFDDIKKHLISTEHCAFMTNKTNYQRLDKLISQGFTMQQFVENIEAGLPNKSSNNSNQDYEFSEPSNKVLLLSSLKNPSAMLPKASRLSDIHCSSPVSVSHSMSPSNPSFGNDAKTKGSSSVQQSNTVLPLLEKPSTPSKKSGLRIPANSSWKSPPRSPFKCLFNSPSRLDVIHSDNDNISKSPINSRAVTKEHSAIALKLKEPSPQNRLLSPLQDAMSVDNSTFCKSLKNSGKKTHKPLENYPPLLLPPPPLPPLGSFPVPKCSKTLKDIEYEASLIEQNPKGLDVLPSNVCRYLSPPMLEKWDTLAVNQSTKSSPEAITPGMHVKRSFSSSSNKKSRTKRQRLFKLGEKWQVLSQQSVKKILFNDESPESFIGFQPQDISKTDYSSNISFEIVSEVLLTDHSDFEWTLGNSESSSQTADTHHQTLSPKEPPTQEDTVPQSPNLLKKFPLTVNNATCTNSFAESDTELNPTAVPCISHPLDTTSPDQPEEEVCDQSVGFVSSNHKHNTPAALPIQGFTIPLIQDIQFPTNLSFENLDTVASTVCNFNSAESSISAQRTSSVPTDTHNTQSSPDMDSVSNSTSAIRSVELLQNLPPLVSREDSQITSIPSMYEQAFPSKDLSISIDNHTRKNSQSLSPSVVTVQEPETPVPVSFQSQDCETSPESSVVYDALPVLNFESSFNLPVQNIEMLSGIVTSNEDTAQLSSEPTALDTAGDNSMLISPELLLQSQYNKPAQDAEPNNNNNNDDEHLVIAADAAAIPLPECMSDNEELTGNDSNMEQQQKQALIQMAELATSSCSSGQYDSSSSLELNPLASEQQISSVAGFVSLSNLATSRDEKCRIRSVSHNFRIQPFNISHPSGSSLNSEKPATHDHKLNRNSNRFDHDCQDSKQSLVRSPGPDHLTDCGFLSHYKSSHCSCSSSSDIQASNSTSASSKSESEITDPLVKSITDNTEAPSDETMVISDWNVKDSGFLSVEELTPKKSPPLTDNKKIAVLAKPCSVVLEKTDLLVPGFINKSNNKQNVFSVKRTSGTVDKTPETVVKPRLLKRLSDTRKTFRLDYIHSNSSGRKSSPHAFAFFKSRCK